MPEPTPAKPCSTLRAMLGAGLLMLLVAVASYFLWREAGFIPMAVLMGPASLLAMGVRNVWIYIAVLALTGLVWAAFSQLLGIQLV